MPGTKTYPTTIKLTTAEALLLPGCLSLSSSTRSYPVAYFTGKPKPVRQILFKETSPQLPPYPQVPDPLMACLHAVLSCSSLTHDKHPPLLSIPLFKPFSSPSCHLVLPQLAHACTDIGVQMWLHQRRECLCHCALSFEDTLRHGRGKTVGFRVIQSDLKS